MKIVVLAGGISTEREISIVLIGKCLHRICIFSSEIDIHQDSLMTSASKCLAYLCTGYDVDAAAAYARSFDGQVEKSIQEGKAFFSTNVIALCQAADVVFLALHGENGENGKVQAAFDLLGIRYTGSGYLGSAIAMDKGLSKQLFWQNEVPTPAGFILRKGEDISLEAHGMTLPCVVKPCCGGSSVGVTIPKTQEEYEAAVADAFSYEDVIVVEEYIKGREFSVGVVDGIAYPIIEIAPIEGFYDYTNKYKAGSTVETCPAVLTKEQTEQMQAYAVKGLRHCSLTITEDWTL